MKKDPTVNVHIFLQHVRQWLTPKPRMGRSKANQNSSQVGPVLTRDTISVLSCSIFFSFKEYWNKHAARVTVWSTVFLRPKPFILTASQNIWQEMVTLHPCSPQLFLWAFLFISTGCAGCFNINLSHLGRWTRSWKKQPTRLTSGHLLDLMWGPSSLCCRSSSSKLAE